MENAVCVEAGSEAPEQKGALAIAKRGSALHIEEQFNFRFNFVDILSPLPAAPGEAKIHFVHRDFQ